MTNATKKPIYEPPRERQDLSLLTKTELYELAEANGVSARPTMRKADLIEALEGAGF